MPSDRVYDLLPDVAKAAHTSGRFIAPSDVSVAFNGKTYSIEVHSKTTVVYASPWSYRSSVPREIRLPRPHRPMDVRGVFLVRRTSVTSTTGRTLISKSRLPYTVFKGVLVIDPKSFASLTTKSLVTRTRTSRVKIRAVSSSMYMGRGENPEL